LREDLAAFARLTGWGYFPIAFIGRLPFAMMIVGVLTVVATVRGSVAEAGLAAAAAGIGTAVLGPVMGSLADRFSQRVVLIATSVISIVSVALLLGLVVSTAPLPAIVVLAFLTGGTTPQVSPFSRSRLVVFANVPRTEATRTRAMSMVMSYESVMDEASFVLGPVLVGVLTALIAPWAPLAVGALITATVVTAFALHRTGAAVVRPASTVARGSVFTVEIAVLALAMLLVGAVFGSILTALTQFMTERGVGEQTGIVYGAMSAGAILVAVSVAGLPSSFSLPARWAGFAAIGLVGSVGLAVASGILGIVIALFASGCGIGAVLVALFSLGARAAPAGRSTTVLTTLQSTLVVGQALATAFGGIVAQAYGAAAGFLITVGAVVALLALAGVYSWRFGAQRG
jgi:MFS family permease